MLHLIAGGGQKRPGPILQRVADPGVEGALNPGAGTDLIDGATSKWGWMYKAS